MTYKLAQETLAVQRLKELLGQDAEDAELFADMIEGETEFGEAIDAVLDRIDHDSAMIAALKEREGNMKTRRERYQKRQERNKTALEDALIHADIQKLERPTATLTVKRTPPSVIVVDETEIPEQYLIPVMPKIDRRELLADLKNGAQIPGASLNNGSITLQIRNK